jgi:hypothetical protein
MGNTDIVPPFLGCAAAIVVAAWFFFVIRYHVLCWKHDTYLNKHFPELSKTDSFCFFVGSASHLKVLSNAISPPPAPDAHLSRLRSKIRLSFFGSWLSLLVLPIVLFLILVLLLAFENGPPASP